MSLLVGSGQITYNGFTFPGAPDSGAVARTVYDEARRNVVYLVYNLHASCLIQNPGGTDATMLDLRQRLMKPGQQLQYESNGFGGFTINANNVKDVAWGPKPNLIEFRPMGGGIAWMIRWECEVAIPECSGAVYRNGILAFNYEAGYNIDGDGYQSRTYKGYFQIPLGRDSGGGRTVTDTADAYWERVQPALLPGFRRATRDRRISYDKSRCDFTIIDEQIPGGAFPEGVTFADGRHRVRSEPNNMVRYSSSLEATYKIAAGADKSKALEAFYLLLRDRTKAAGGGATSPAGGQGANNFQGPANEFGPVPQLPGVGPIGAAVFGGAIGQNAGGASPGPVSGGAVLLASFESDEGLYNGSHTVSFSASWTFTSNIADCVRDGGQWREVPNTDWNRWSTSSGVVEAMGPRGTAQLRHQAADDAIIDLCGGDVRVLSSQSNQGQRQLRAVSRNDARVAGLEPRSSWLKFYCDLIIRRNPNAIRLKNLPLRDLSQNAQLNSLGTATIVPRPFDFGAVAQGLLQGAFPQVPVGGAQGGNHLVNEPPGGAEKDPIQHRATPSYRVILYGFGLRAGYEVPVPKLVKVGGVDVTEVDGGAGRGIVGNWDGIPIFGSWWRIEYLCAEPPSKEDIVSLPNPAAGFSSGAQSR